MIMPEQARLNLPANIKTSGMDLKRLSWQRVSFPGIIREYSLNKGKIRHWILTQCLQNYLKRPEKVWLQYGTSVEILRGTYE